MIDALSLVPALSTGVLLGIFFFGGLFYTIRKGLPSRHPAFLFLGSWLLRMIVVAGGFFLIAAGQREKLLACAAGFMIARSFVRILACKAEKPGAQKMEADHAPQP